MKEPFKIDWERAYYALNKIGDIAEQIHAHDPSLPKTFEDQLRELLARPTALDFMRAMPSAESLLGGIANNLERPLTASDSAIVIATLDELYRAIVASIIPPQPSIGNPFEPPPPPPTKAVEASGAACGKVNFGTGLSCDRPFGHAGDCEFRSLS